VNFKDLFKKGNQNWFDGNEKQYEVNKGKADVKPYSFGKMLIFAPVTIAISCLMIIVSIVSAPTAMDWVKAGLDSVLGGRADLKPSAAEVLFTDVKGDSKFFDSLSYLKKNGIISGFADNSFHPDQEIKRAEFVKTVVNAKKQFPLALNYNNCFKDVKNEWFAPSICFAKSNGWVGGLADGKFHPDDGLTRDDTMKVLVKAFAIDHYPEDITAATEKQNHVSRGEAFQMLYRVMQL